MFPSYSVQQSEVSEVQMAMKFLVICCLLFWSVSARPDGCEPDTVVDCG